MNPETEKRKKDMVLLVLDPRIVCSCLFTLKKDVRRQKWIKLSSTMVES